MNNFFRKKSELIFYAILKIFTINIIKFEDIANRYRNWNKIYDQKCYSIYYCFMKDRG